MRRFLIPLLCLALPAAADPPLLWSDLHDGGAGQLDEGIAVVMSAGGHPVVGGVRTTAGGRADILLRKLDRANGGELWRRAYSDPGGSDMILADMVADHRGDLLVAGYLSDCDG